MIVKNFVRRGHTHRPEFVRTHHRDGRPKIRREARNTCHTRAFSDTRVTNTVQPDKSPMLLLKNGMIDGNEPRKKLLIIKTSSLHTIMGT